MLTIVSKSGECRACPSVACYEKWAIRQEERVTRIMPAVGSIPRVSLKSPHSLVVARLIKPKQKNSGRDVTRTSAPLGSSWARIEVHDMTEGTRYNEPTIWPREHIRGLIRL